MAQGLALMIRAELDELAALRQRVIAVQTGETTRIDSQIAELTAAEDLVKRDVTVEPIVDALIRLKAKRG